MDENEVHCPRWRNGADTVVKPGNDGRVKHGRCLRCEKDFQATPGPICGSYRIDGSYGVAGIRFTTLPDTVTCMNSRTGIPARDPGPVRGPSSAS